MIKRVEYHKHDHWFEFALGIKTPYEEDCHNKHNLIHIALFGHSWWIKIPQLIKPKEKWVDLSNATWDVTPNADGRKGYTNQIQRDYGFSFNKEAIHIHYGIQPGEWSSRDPENSDHTKVLWWPWQLTIVRHDLLYPNGDVYHRNLYPRKNQKHLHWYEVFSDQVKPNATQVQVAEYVDLVHYTKDGRKQESRIRLTGEELEWRPKCTRWLPIFRHIRRTVDCDSKVELGERAGEWKGGLMGWSCKWEQGDTMKHAFRDWYKTWDGR